MSDATTPNLVDVTQERHGHRFWRRFTSYAFARGLPFVDVVLAELEHVASAFPLVFRKTPDEAEIEPVALFRLGACGTTPFVAEDGTWRGTYVPSALRAYPFTARPADGGGEMALMVDEAGGLVTDDPADEPFFATDGAVSPALDQVLTFFRTRAQSARVTRTACRALVCADLLTPLPRLAGMTDDDAAGLLTVETASLNALGPDRLPALWKSGALRLACAHRISLSHADWIARVARAAALSGPTRKNPVPAQNAALSDFLDALSAARANDTGSA